MDYGLGPADIAIEGDVTRGHQYVPRARHMLSNLLERMRVGGLQQGIDHWVLDSDDGSYAYAIVAGSVRKVVIVVGPVESDEYGGVRGMYAQVPDFLSGVVIGGTIPKQAPPPPDVVKMSSFWPTPSCANLHNLLSSVQDIARLTVEPHQMFGELNNPFEQSPVKFSQYVRLKPTMYSGKMRAVVQFLMGFGRQLRTSIYDQAKPRIPQPEPPPTRPGNEDAHLTAYERDVKNNGLQIRYDWRWFRTHGITRGSDGTLWLVEIGSARGVVAFRLPMNPFTKDQRFREKLENLGDGAGLYVLDELGGWPTGEPMPSAAIDSWKRAGLVLDLASADDLQPFYSNGPYSSQLGWAFSMDGREAHNTCNGWDGDMQNSQHFAINLTIGAFHDVDPPLRSGALKAKFRGLVGQDGFRDRYPAVIAKIDRMENRDCDSFLHRTDPIDVLFNELDQLQLDPCASGDAHISLVSKSPLYDPAKYQRMIKFPHPELGYLLSHDMRSSGPVPETRCDATMHVFWAQGKLKYVKYFRDMRQSDPEHTDDYEDCMYVGTWHSHDDIGPRSVAPQMYSDDFDDRIELAGGTRDVVTVGVDLGYCQIAAQDDITYPTRSWIFRVKRFESSIETKVVNGRTQTSAVTVPFYDRCAYYYTSVLSSENTQRSKVWRLDTLTDPWFCETWRNFGGWTSGHAEHPDHCCICQVRTVRSPAPRYNPRGYSGGAGDCADLTDSGPWCFLCDNADAMFYFIPPPPLPPFESETTQSDYHRITRLVNDTDFSPLMIEDAHFDSSHYQRWWFIPSPDPETNIWQYIDVTHNAFGEGEAMKYYFQPNEGPIKTIGGPFPPGYNGENITFIGVVP